MLKKIAGIAILAIAVTAIVIAYMLIDDRYSTPEKAPEIVDTTPNTAYGIVVDSLLVIKDKVRKNQFLSEILRSYKVDYQKIDLLVKRSILVFDLRKIKAGNNYAVLCKNDSINEVQYFIYEISPASYVVFDLKDSLHVHTGEKEVETVVKSTSGIITSSLWNAMMANNTDPELASSLSEVFAWNIDFFGIQKGDFYKVIYEEMFVEGKSIGIGKILSALFNSEGHDYYAFELVQDSVTDYFDDKGQNVRRAFLKAPLQFKRISSHFSHSRMHPILKVRRPHLGVDYAAAYGTPVRTVGDGTIVFSGKSGGSGNMVKVRHNGTYTTAYLHLSGFGRGIKRGAHVRQGDVIGFVGSTGRSTGPHLDFRFYQNGEPVDPLRVQSPPAEPVKDKNLAEFYKLMKDAKAKLDSIALPSNRFEAAH
jgi:murein DD-endopeptidase MepM/ murein hydrolase activator NlpD